ncbi:MAG: hypothetical protein GON13_02140 [Nanoarchaeota archaeon]|nr:hypothetical protein [Nanoarchaeota archaeon]
MNKEKMIMTKTVSISDPDPKWHKGYMGKIQVCSTKLKNYIGKTLKIVVFIEDVKI